MQSIYTEVLTLASDCIIFRVFRGNQFGGVVINNLQMALGSRHVEVIGLAMECFFSATGRIALLLSQTTDDLDVI